MSPPAPDMTHILERLEAVATKLEKHSQQIGSTKSSNDSEKASAQSAASSMYLSQLRGPMDDFLKRSEKIGGPLMEQSKLVQNLISMQAQIIQMASVSKKPDPNQLQKVMLPLSKAIEEIIAFKDKNRTSPLANHLTTVADGIAAFGWVVVEPTPAPYISEMKDAAQFYGNRVIKQFKEKEPVHVEWVNSYTQLLMSLNEYVKQEHTTGLRWNPKGGEAQFSINSSPPPPPPPPLPSFTQTTATAPSAASDLSAVFNQLNVGEKVTAGLKKVDPSQMTHKNPNLRANNVSPAKDDSMAATSRTTTPATKMEPKTYFEFNRWNLENYTQRRDLEITQADLKQAVYIYGCVDCIIQVKGKVKSVSLDACKKTAVVVDTLVSSLDVVNSQNIKLQVNGTVPTICVDKADGVQLYLSKETLSSEIYTAKSTEVNVVLPPENEESDSIEKFIPEQIKTTICPKTRNLLSSPVEHTA